MKPLIQNLLAALAMWCCVAPANAFDGGREDYDRYPSANELGYTIYSAEYNDARERMSSFLEAKKYFIVKQNERDNSHHYEFTVAEQEIATIDSMCNSLGYVSSKVLNSYNNEERLVEANLELERLEQLKKDYQEMLVRMDSVKSKLYYEHWEKIRGIDEDIYKTRKQIRQLEQVQNMYSVSVDIHDEAAAPGSSRISFVHMPGAEYVMQFTENPTQGVSFPQYQGVFLKYLFTRGKSYLGLGALKATSNLSSDTLAYNEMFTLVFGQDWYSRHLGRGNNKLLNPYIGYQVGYSLASSPNVYSSIPFASPAFGIELLKTKFLLLDVNASYFLPLTNQNQSLRALRVGAALNIVF